MVNGKWEIKISQNVTLSSKNPTTIWHRCMIRLIKKASENETNDNFYLNVLLTVL